MSNAYWEPLDFELPPVPDTAASGWQRWIDTAREAPGDIINPPAEQVVNREPVSRGAALVRGAAPVRIEDRSGPGLEPEDRASQQTPRTRCASPDPDKQKTPAG